MAAAEMLALPDMSGLHEPASRVHDEVGVRTAQSGPVLQLNHLQLVRVLLNANIPGTGRHDFAGALVIGLHHGLRHALVHQLRKTHGGTVRQPDAGIAGEAAGGAENEAVGVFEQLPVHHDKVVGQGVDTVVQGFRAGLEQLLRGKGHKNSGAGRGKPPLYLHLIETQGQAAHQPFLWLKVQRHQTAVVLLRDGTGLEHVVVQLFSALRRVHQQERHQEHALIPALEVLQQLLGLLAVGGKVRGDDIHVIPGPDRFFLFLDLGAVQVGDLALDGLDGADLIHRLDVHGHHKTGLHIQKIRQNTVIQLRGQNLEEGHRAKLPAHAEGLAARKFQGRGGNEVFGR